MDAAGAQAEEAEDQQEEGQAGEEEVRLGYSFWGFLGDIKVEGGQPVSTPDGNATYSWSILWEAQRRGWETHLMQRDRDAEAFYRYGPDIFGAFSREKRLSAYMNVRLTQRTSLSAAQMNCDEFPVLDVLLLEWRFPIPGRNCVRTIDGVNLFPENMVDSSGAPLQPDLLRQQELLLHYKNSGTTIVIWDLDHKLTEFDERHWMPDTIFETSVRPRKQFLDRIRVEPPICVEDLLQFPTLPVYPGKKLAYVGSRYERDDVIDQYIRSISETYPQQVVFYGNWLKTLDECQRRWPRIQFVDRITTSQFRAAYGNAVACPLLAKRSYLESGFITPRVWEALLFGTIPIGLDEARGIGEYVLFRAESGRHMTELVQILASMPVNERDQLRKKNVEKLEHMDVRHFVDAIERAAS
jgi:hypothetical protein